MNNERVRLQPHGEWSGLGLIVSIDCVGAVVVLPTDSSVMRHALSARTATVTHRAWVTTKVGDALLHPLQRRALVLQSVITRAVVCLAAQRMAAQEPEDIQAVVCCMMFAD